MNIKFVLNKEYIGEIVSYNHVYDFIRIQNNGYKLTFYYYFDEYLNRQVDISFYCQIEKENKNIYYWINMKYDKEKLIKALNKSKQVYKEISNNESKIVDDYFIKKDNSSLKIENNETAENIVEIIDYEFSNNFEELINEFEMILNNFEIIEQKFYQSTEKLQKLFYKGIKNIRERQ
ncbi:MAG: hypothetical protein ACO2OX_01445 [Candidatus Nanopusillus sp.]